MTFLSDTVERIPTSSLSSTDDKLDDTDDENTPKVKKALDPQIGLSNPKDVRAFRNSLTNILLCSPCALNLRLRCRGDGWGACWRAPIGRAYPSRAANSPLAQTPPFVAPYTDRGIYSRQIGHLATICGVLAEGSFESRRRPVHSGQVGVGFRGGNGLRTSFADLHKDMRVAGTAQALLTSRRSTSRTYDNAVKEARFALLVNPT
ncbi:hypothetical protein NQ318_021584 [Aromia moschata]|uniref:Uncharacterized protein n=1 Tax=Aromia moschata TaxID=1265417 RepID=A0AAV8YKE3_9CUCU|nr:hypothetical protein NQ318_021584 [Aromia moschata]